MAEEKISDERKPPSKLLSYLRLFRIPNVFTAAADVMMGFLFVQTNSNWQTDPRAWATLLALVLASAMLYTAGMILNDVYDIEQDLAERPARPLPSGAISVSWARFLGYDLLILGAALAALAGWLNPLADSVAWRSAAIGIALAACVVLYDRILKHTPLAPLAMGGCRFLNVLLGMSIGTVALAASPATLFFDGSSLMVACGIGVYIVGVTVFARNEAQNEEEKKNPRVGLIFGAAIMAVGLGLLAAYPTFGGGARRLALPEFWWLILILLLGGIILRRALAAIADPQPKKIQAAIKQCIFSLIILDASVCLSTGNTAWGVAIVALLLPMFVLGKWVYST